MPGHAPPARCLDLTRLISRVGKGPFTGVDRVEFAYLRRLVLEPQPLFCLVRTSLGYVLLDKKGATRVFWCLAGDQPWGQMDWIGHLNRKAPRLRRMAEADLRRNSIGRCRPGQLDRLVRMMPPGTAYLNVGHSNLTKESLSVWDGPVSVFVHDMIPLDFPQYQRPGTVRAFEVKMQLVAEHADLVICNSNQTAWDVERWWLSWDARPKTVAAYLGSDLPDPDPGPDPMPNLPTSYFVILGTIEPRKNHALLLDIWADLVDDLGDAAPHLVVAGKRGWANAAVFDRLDQRPPHVTEMPGLSDAQVAGLIQGAQALLFPSFAEGYGLPAIEAAAAQIPVLCSDLPVFDEVLGNIPIYAAPTDRYRWKKSILQIAENNKAAQQTQPPKFRVPTWDGHFNTVLSVT